MNEKYTKNIYLNILTKTQFKNTIELLNSLVKQQSDISEDDISLNYKVNSHNIRLFKKSYKIMIQGKNVVAFAIKLNLPYIKYEKQEKISLFNSDSNKLVDYWEYIGCDEVGNGDFFGGMTFAAVYVNQKSIELFKKIGVNDSKKLTDEFIISVYDKIINNCIYIAKILTPIEYNTLYSKFKNQNIVKTFGHNFCIANLQDKCKKLFKKHIPVIIDEYCSESNYLKYLSVFSKKIDGSQKIDHFEIKAESKYIGVAAASIIARYHFLKMINKLNKQLHHDIPSLNKNVKIPLGSTNKETIKKLKNCIVKNLSEKDLTKFMKTHFSFSDNNSTEK